MAQRRSLGLQTLELCFASQQTDVSTVWGKHCIKLIKAIRLIAQYALLLLLLLALGGLGKASIKCVCMEEGYRERR